MLRSRLILSAVYRIVRLRFMDPRISRCMLASLLFVMVTTGPLGRSHGLSARPEWNRRGRAVAGIVSQIGSFCR